MQPVTVKIIDILIKVDWVEGKNLQYYIEQARDSAAGTPQKFDFAIQYYGYEGGVYYGYMIIMMLDNQHFDNYDNNNKYWEYTINTVFATLGIDSEYPKPGDLVEFDYNLVEPAKPQSAGLKAKLALHK
jgi:hypothetical protein